MRIESIKTEPDRAGRYWLTLEDGRTLVFNRKNDTATAEDYNKLLTYLK